MAKTTEIIQKAVKELADVFEITDEGEIDEYLGLKILKLQDSRIKMIQPYLIDQTLKRLGFDKRTRGQEGTSHGKQNSAPRCRGRRELDEEWDYL